MQTTGTLMIFGQRTELFFIKKMNMLNRQDV